VAKPVKHQGGWRIRWIDHQGQRQSETHAAWDIYLSFDFAMRRLACAMFAFGLDDGSQTLRFILSHQLAQMDDLWKWKGYSWPLKRKPWSM